jgi:hypothetical protein
VSVSNEKYGIFLDRIYPSSHWRATPRQAGLQGFLLTVLQMRTAKPYRLRQALRALKNRVDYFKYRRYVTR